MADFQLHILEIQRNIDFVSGIKISVQVRNSDRKRLCLFRQVLDEFCFSSAIGSFMLATVPTRLASLQSEYDVFD